MLIYEVTCILTNKNIEEKFEIYMKEKHIKEVFQTGCFLTASFVKTDEFMTYKSIYFVKDQTTLDHYIANFAPQLRKDVTNLFPEGNIQFKRNVYTILTHHSL